MALPPGVSAKTVTLGIGTFFDGTVVSGRVTITAPENVVHTATNRPLYSSEMTKPLVDGVVTFDLCPTDAEGLNNKSWTYKMKAEIQGAIKQPEVIYFLLPTAGPDVVDLDGLVTVPSSAGVPIAVDVLTTEAVDPVTADYINDPTSATSVALREALVPKWSPSTAYKAATDYVLNPSGQIVQPIADFTSGSTYDASKWNVISGSGGGSTVIDNGDGTLTIGDAGSLPDATTTAKGVVQLAGDLAGTAAAPMVPGLASKVSTPTGGTDGQALVKSGTTVVWGTVSGGGTTPDATTAAKGIVQLAGDLAGTAAAPTVAKINGVTPAVVATSGSYADLTSKPTIPTVGAAGAGAAVALSSTDASVTNARTPSAHATTHAAGGSDPVAIAASQVTGLATVATSGSYNDLTSKPAAGFGSYSSVFGDTSDGAVVLDGTVTVAWANKAGNFYTLTRDVHATDFSINAGITLNTGVWRIFSGGTLTNNGTIASNGNAGNANGNAGGAMAPGAFGSSAGGAGGLTTGTAGAAVGIRIGVGSGGAGGLGPSGAGAAGGVGNSGVAQFRIPMYALTGAVSYNASLAQLSGAPGGGGGGGDGTNKGGGGGGGGGALAIFAHAMTNAGTITANGGTGGTPTTGNAGGGGGGGGGMVLVYTLSAWTNTGTATANGGTPGAGVGTGASGVAGNPGTVSNFVIV